MGASARIVIAFLLVSVVYSVPTGHYGTSYLDDDKDLSAQSSKIIPAAEASPTVAHHTPDADHSIELVSDAQNFFPSFANLFELRRNNYRFGGFQSPGSQEGAYSQRPNSYRSLLNYPSFSNYINLEGLGKHSPTAAPIAEPSSVLGSGNFGIIRGGTFLSQNDEEDDGFSSSDYGFGYNGHGRPSHNGYVGNPRPSYGQDQFANFRDFADINAPSNYVVVYANRNATLDEVSEESRQVASKPRNIFETLQGIEVPQPTNKKISKTKSKLEATKQKMLKKKEQWKKGNSKYHSQKHEVDEPLLALS